jgi:diguanylate cyclase (GGDEF)-like protein/PAS domain S-box-containing protein
LSEIRNPESLLTDLSIQRRYVLVKALLPILGVIAVFSAVLDYKGEISGIVLWESVYGVLCLLMMIGLRKVKYLIPVIYLFTLSSIALTLYLFTLESEHISIILWVIIAPAFGIFLLGHNAGLLMVLLYLPASAILFSLSHPQVYSELPLTVIFSVVALVLALLSLTLFYESRSHIAETKLLEELRKSEHIRAHLKEYQEGINASKDLFLVSDAQHRIVVSNQALNQNWNLVKGGAQGEYLENILGQNIFEKIMPVLEAALEGINSESEVRIIHEEKNRLYLLKSAPMHSQSTKIKKVISLFRDITEQALMINEQKKFFDLSNDLIGITDLNGVYLRVNPAWELHTGWTPQSMVGRRFSEFVHPDDLSASESKLNLLNEGGVLKAFQNRIQCQNGTYVWLSWQAVPDTEEGRVYVVARDVTEQLKTEERQKQNEQRLSALLILSRMNAASEPEIRKFAMKEIISLTQSEDGFYHFIDEDAGLLNPLIWSVSEEGGHMTSLSIKDLGEWADCLRLRRPVMLNDLSVLNNIMGLPPVIHQKKRGMFVPVFHHDKIVAISAVYGRSDPYEDNDLNQFTLFMNSMWGVIRQKRTEEEVFRMSIEDGLTGLANRRRFDEMIGNEWQRALREKEPMSMIMLDIDFFKNYNDEYGHLMGDDCLKKIGNAFKSCIGRPGDLAARYGGEEFVAVLGNTKLSGAEHLAKKIAQEVESLKIPHKSSLVNDFVTVSMGIHCMVPHPAASFEALIKGADIALYKAKSSGRKCYKIFDENTYR